MQTQKSPSRRQSSPLRSALLAAVVCAGAAALPFARLDARQMPAVSVYAIEGAKIVTADATIDKGNLVMRDGLIEAVGPGAAVPADAVVVDGANLTVYPGLIDMSNTTAVETPAPSPNPAAQPAEGRGGGRGRGGNAGPTPTWADAERAKREALLNPDFDAASHVKLEGPDMQRLAAAGITTVLAVPSAGLFRGTSALVNVVAPPDRDDVSRVADYRRGEVVIASPVAEHVTFAGRGGGPGYPAALLGDIAFVRQAFSDAQWQQAARTWAASHTNQPRPNFEPALDALAPALDRRMPVSFEAGEFREILRALAMAKEFNLDPIITGGIEADQAAADLKAANARVILSVAIPQAEEGRGGRENAEVPMRVQRMRQNLPKVPAALDEAGVLYAFSSEGLQNPADFVKDVARAVHDGGLPEQQALRALTVNAAKIAGAADRVGTLAKGQIANVLLVDGDLFSGQAHIKQVFIEGRPVDITPAPQPGNGRRGGGGARH
ncbi:MAG TPA: amidohydrolase family protein [Vicinamibacterales bacterium]|jgi:imidazolonepropionase-like amidohydrolase|nr:amidohydrolase family protein [Vicinamibacterales bacterium]